MTTLRTLAALSVAALATACASPTAINTSTATPDIGIAHASVPVGAMEPRMKAMKDMQQKMMSAKTPAERQALMADHMKVMQDGMAMMRERHGSMQGMQGMGDGKGMPADMAERHEMMTNHMAMMQMMMDMMMQRMSATAAAQ